MQNDTSHEFGDKVRQAETFHLIRQYNTALDSFAQAIKLDPESAWAYAHLGKVYLDRGEKGDYDQALQHFTTAIKLKPSYTWAIAHQGETYRLLLNYAKAEKYFDQALQLEPNYAWALAHRAATYCNGKMGESYYQKALTDLERAIELMNQDYAWATVYKATAYVLLGNYQAAFIALMAGVLLDNKIFGKKTHPANELGQLCSFQKHYAEAVICYDIALREGPDDDNFRSDVWYNYAVARIRWKGLTEETQANIDKARSILQQVEGDAEVRTYVLYRQAGLDALEGKNDDALNHLREAISHGKELLGKKNPYFKGRAKGDPAWLALRDNPDFDHLFRKSK